MDRIANIVVPTDLSPLSEAAAARAVNLAQLDGATIHLVHAVQMPLIATPYEAAVPASVWDEIREQARAQLEEARKRVEERGAPGVTARVADTPDAVQAIEDAVSEHDADLVVMGTHGYGGLRHAFLGSVAERTLRGIDRPVLAVKEELAAAARPIDKILVAVDFSPHADRAVEVATGLSKRLGASIDVVHAWDLPRDYITYSSTFGVDLERKIREASSEGLEQIRNRLVAQDVTPTLHVRRGNPANVIADLATEIDCGLIVMGTRGSTGLSHILLGSVAERTLRTAPCSVLTVKAQETSARIAPASGA